MAMALAGIMRHYPFFLALILLLAISCIVTLALYFLPHSFTPTSLDSQHGGRSRPFSAHLEKVSEQLVARPPPRVYMISLPRRTDRRDKMRKLQAVTGLSWTFVDATDSTADVVGRIMERVRWSRASVYLHAIDAAFLGWWSDHHDELGLLDTNPKGSALWELAPSDPTSADYTHPLPASPLRDQRLTLEAATGLTIPRLDAVRPEDFTRIPSSDMDLSSPRTATRAVTDAPESRLFQLPYWRTLARGTIACWHSHIGLIRMIASESAHIGANDTGVIILEDDIDMELDIQQRITHLWEDLPPDWDILFLGHCWSAEATYPALAPHSQIHRSHSPKCTHAYGLSRQGAGRILDFLQRPYMAYSRPVDAAILELIRSKELNAYSVYPSVIIQTKDTSSDIFPGNGSRWRDVLQNSALGLVDKDSRD
ncbi:glycosyltransferase family 25 protein [Ceratobasidium sp. AG-Ba]|nr:glycosyltransferase family 25 protein [Ceratobasidium sp. AG-Ba]